MNKHLNDALIFLGIELGAFGTFTIAKETNISALYWTSLLAIVVFGIFSAKEVILMFKDYLKPKK